MDSGPRNVTSTTTTEIPAFLQGPLEQATRGASDQYFWNSSGGRAGQDAIQQEQGVDALFNRGQTGSPLVQGAQGLTSKTIAGDFLSPDSNPYLEQTFNRAAELTRGRLDSEFAGAGRNLGATMPARSQELQDLAGSIYGGNYQRERDRQVGAVNQALPLANADFTDIQAMIDAGGFTTNQFIDRLAALIPNAGGTTTATQPVYRTGLF